MDAGTCIIPIAEKCRLLQPIVTHVQASNGGSYWFFVLSTIVLRVQLYKVLYCLYLVWTYICVAVGDAGAA